MTGKNVKSIIPDDHDEAVKVFIREPSSNGLVWNEREIWFPQEALKAIAAQTEPAPKAVDFNRMRIDVYEEYISKGHFRFDSDLTLVFRHKDKEKSERIHLSDCDVIKPSSRSRLDARLNEIDKLEASMKGAKK